MTPASPATAARQERFAGSRRPHQKHSFGNACAEPAVLLRIAQEFDDLLQLVLRLVDACNVGESDFGILLDVDFCAAFADGHEPAGALAETPNDEHPHPEEQQCRQHPRQNVSQQSARDFAKIGDIVLVQFGREVGTDPGRDELLEAILLLLFERSLD